MGHLPKLKNNKNGGLRECGRRRSGWCMLNDLKLVVTSPIATSIYKNAILPHLITKMPLLGL